jgi:hypothetical protein
MSNPGGKASSSKGPGTDLPSCFDEIEKEIEKETAAALSWRSMEAAVEDELDREVADALSFSNSMEVAARTQKRGRASDRSGKKELKVAAKAAKAEAEAADKAAKAATERSAKESRLQLSLIV